MPSATPPARRRRDPRPYQIAVLSGLIVYGALVVGLPLRAATAVAIVIAAQGVQWLCTRLWRLERFDPRSAMISALSLILLLRTDSPALAMVAAAVAVASKFVIRWRGKHVFNPTNFALVALMLISDRVWVSPGQWGSAAFVGLLLACLGVLVTHHAARSDVTWAFLASYAGVLFGRAAWLGDPWAIPLHQLQSGTLLIFAFFMISDPKTTPDARAGRLLFAALVAAVGAGIQFLLYQPNGLLWSLALCAPLVPAIDRLLPAGRYRWAVATPAPRGRRPLAATS